MSDVDKLVRELRGFAAVSALEAMRHRIGKCDHCSEAGTLYVEESGRSGLCPRHAEEVSKAWGGAIMPNVSEETVTRLQALENIVRTVLP